MPTDLEPPPDSEARRSRRLTPPELAEFLHRLDGYGGTPQIHLALRLLMLTLVRPGELRAACWSQFNFQTAQWRVPVVRAGAATVHVVPLSSAALETVMELRQYARDGELLFPGRVAPDRAIDESALRVPLYRVGYRGRVTGLIFRSMARQVLTERGWPRAAIDAQLGFLPRRPRRERPADEAHAADPRDMLEEWAAYLDGLRRRGTAGATAA